VLTASAGMTVPAASAVSVACSCSFASPISANGPLPSEQHQVPELHPVHIAVLVARDSPEPRSPGGITAAAVEQRGRHQRPVRNRRARRCRPAPRRPPGRCAVGPLTAVDCPVAQAGEPAAALSDREPEFVELNAEFVMRARSAG
jgi:hypothetical protein